MRRALVVLETSYGLYHPHTATPLIGLAELLKATNRLLEAEPLMRRGVTILRRFEEQTGHEHPHWQLVLRNYRSLLRAMGVSETNSRTRMRSLTQSGSDPGPLADHLGRMRLSILQRIAGVIRR